MSTWLVVVFFGGLFVLSTIVNVHHQFGRGEDVLYFTNHRTSRSNLYETTGLCSLIWANDQLGWQLLGDLSNDISTDRSSDCPKISLKFGWSGASCWGSHPFLCKPWFQRLKKIQKKVQAPNKGIHIFSTLRPYFFNPPYFFQPSPLFFWPSSQGLFFWPSHLIRFILFCSFWGGGLINLTLASNSLHVGTFFLWPSNLMFPACLLLTSEPVVPCSWPPQLIFTTPSFYLLGPFDGIFSTLTLYFFELMFWFFCCVVTGDEQACGWCPTGAQGLVTRKLGDRVEYIYIYWKWKHPRNVGCRR